MSTTDRAIRECDVGVEVAGLDCSEPPCMAVVRAGYEAWYGRLTNCAAWTDVYGEGGTIASSTVTCPDGEEEPFAMVGPGNIDYAEELERDDPMQGIKRLQFRQEQVKYDYVCEGHMDEP